MKNKMEDKDVMKTGTTTVGIVCKEGVVLAADKRATAGYLIAQKDAQKVHLITENIAVTWAGSVSDIQLLTRLVQAELRLKKMRTSQEISVKEAANLTARLVYGNIRQLSMIPGVTHFLMGGYDDSGFYLFDLFPDGSISDAKRFVSSGSGSVMAYGVLETLYKKDLSVDEGIKLAAKCINAAIQRDIASGQGIDIVTITKDGAKRVVSKEVEFKIEV